MGAPPDGHERDVRASAHRSPGPDGSDPPTLDALYRDHADFVWRAVLRMGIVDAHAEDAVHEVFMVARRKLSGFRGDAAPSTWLYAIARGVCANLRRSRDRARRRLELAPAPQPAPNPEEAAARANAADLVERFLDGLPQAQREVFVLSDIEGLAGPDVAAALRIPLGTAYSRLRLARRRFEAFVKETRA